MPTKAPAPQPDSGYAGYSSLTDYINVHMALAGHNRESFSVALGRTHTYISTICEGHDRAGHVRPPHYAPSAEMCDSIADFFLGSSASESQRRGERHIVRVLAGKETRPPDPEATALAAQIMALPTAERDVVRRVVGAMGLGRGRRREK